MGCTKWVIFLAAAVLLDQSICSAGYSFSFQFGGSSGNPCKEDVCGKGKCFSSSNSSSSSSAFGFECQCDPGWKQARLRDDDSLNFMPCVIPNCSLNYNCAKTPAAAPRDDNKRDNSSFFDPCFWTDCGGGSCNKETVFTHSCRCEEGYYNLFNSSAFPCFKDCSLGGDCADLGINVGNNTLAPPDRRRPGSADDSGGYGLASRGREGLNGFVAAAATATLVLVGKYV